MTMVAMTVKSAAVTTDARSRRTKQIASKRVGMTTYPRSAYSSGRVGVSG